MAQSAEQRFPLQQGVGPLVVAILDEDAGLLRMGMRGRARFTVENRSDRDAQVLEIGTRVAGDVAYYSDIDMVAPAGGKPAVYTHRDGTPYEGIIRRGPSQS